MVKLYKLSVGNMPPLGSECLPEDGKLTHERTVQELKEKNPELRWMSEDEIEPGLRSENPKLDGFRKPKAIVARISADAARQLGMVRPGWYLTSLPVEHY